MLTYVKPRHMLTYAANSASVGWSRQIIGDWFEHVPNINKFMMNLSNAVSILASLIDRDSIVSSKT